MNIPKDDNDPFIKNGKVMSLTRGIWEYSYTDEGVKKEEPANMVGMLGI